MTHPEPGASGGSTGHVDAAKGRARALPSTGRPPQKPPSASDSLPGSPAQPALPADSAGRPWAGRTFDQSTSGYADDGGDAPHSLIEALLAFRAGDGTPRPAGAQSAVVAAVQDARLLVPLVAEAGDTAVDHRGRTVDKSQELSIVTVTAPDGRSVLPVFTSADAMARWNPLARPVPSDARRIALAAAAENTDLVVIDPTAATEFALRRPMVWAIAKSQPWVSPFDDGSDAAHVGAVAARFQASIADHRAVVAVSLEQGDPDARLRAPEVTVVLTLVAGLDRLTLGALLARLSERWAADPVIADRVDSLAVRLQSHPAG